MKLFVLSTLFLIGMGNSLANPSQKYVEDCISYMQHGKVSRVSNEVINACQKIDNFYSQYCLVLSFQSAPNNQVPLNMLKACTQIRNRAESQCVRDNYDANIKNFGVKDIQDCNDPTN